MPLMPAREPRPEPLARARARLEFDDLLRRRQAAIVAAGSASEPVDLDARRTAERNAREAAALLEGVARSFADAVDRENSSRGILRTGVQVEYVDAVVLTGNAGALVVDAVEYENAPVYWQARAGDVDSVIRGRDLDGYLRSGDRKYAEQLGLA